MADKILRGPEQRLQKISFGKVLYQSLQNGKSEKAMIDAHTGEVTTYKEMLERTVSLAQHMNKWGIKKNDAISICSENTLYFTVPAISALYLGITVAPINQFYTERELLHAMNISKPKVVFCTDNILKNVINVSNKIRCVKKIVVVNNCDKVVPGGTVLRMKDLFFVPKPSNFEITEVKMDDVCAILCSSGTTGLPKGVMLTHQGFNASLHYLQHNGFGNYSSEKTAMCLLPFYHAYGYISHLCMIATNLKIIVLPKFEESLFLKSIEEYQINYATLVPPLVLFLSKHPIVDKYNISSLKEIVCGAAPLGKDVQDAVKQRLRVNIRQGYGLTELTLAASLAPFHLPRPGSVGLLVPGMECKITDIQTGESLGPYKNGELCFRGAQIMKGYVGDPKATAATIDKDGWLHSGDVGYYDQDQFLYIVDRYKELIKYKGFQVPPAEIESLLLGHKDILDCAVIGKPDDEAGELPLAFVVKKLNAKITEKDVFDFVAKNVSYHKRLHGGVQFVNSIPKNPTGKILRRVLREQLKLSPSKL